MNEKKIILNLTFFLFINDVISENFPPKSKERIDLQQLAVLADQIALCCLAASHRHHLVLFLPLLPRNMYRYYIKVRWFCFQLSVVASLPRRTFSGTVRAGTQRRLQHADSQLLSSRFITHNLTDSCCYGYSGFPPPLPFTMQQNEAELLTDYLSSSCFIRPSPPSSL